MQSTSMRTPVDRAIAFEQAELQRRLCRRRRGLTKAADRCITHRLREVLEEGELVVWAADRAARYHAMEKLLLAHGADSAWHALPARLVAEEPGDPEHCLSHVGIGSKDKDHARAERRPDRARALEGEWHVQLLVGDERAGRATKQDRPRATRAHSTRKLQQLTQRGTERHLIAPGLDHIARETEKLGPCRSLGSNRRVGGATLKQDVEDVDQGLDVIDDGGFAEEAGLNGEGGLVARLAALAFDGVEERGLFAADVCPSPAADFDVESETASHDVGAEQAHRAAVFDGVLETAPRQRVLTADVEVALLTSGGIGRDSHGFN